MQFYTQLSNSCTLFCILRCWRTLLPSCFGFLTQPLYFILARYTFSTRLLKKKVVYRVFQPSQPTHTSDFCLFVAKKQVFKYPTLRDMWILRFDTCSAYFVIPHGLFQTRPCKFSSTVYFQLSTVPLQCFHFICWGRGRRRAQSESYVQAFSQLRTWYSIDSNVGCFYKRILLTRPKKYSFVLLKNC